MTWDQCCRCGKFVSMDETVKISFTPDHEFSPEKTEITCMDCANIGRMEAEITRLRKLIVDWSEADDSEHPAVEALWDEAVKISMPLIKKLEAR